MREPLFIFCISACMVIAWENSRHLVTPLPVFPPNDIWETSAEIPYWWCVTTQIWVVLLIGLHIDEEVTFSVESNFPHDMINQKHYPDLSSTWHVISMEFLCSFLRRHLAGKPAAVAWPNVSCFLRLVCWPHRNTFWSSQPSCDA